MVFCRTPDRESRTPPLTRPFLRNRFNLLQHLLHPPANFFPLFPQLHRLAPQRHQLLVALFQLLPRLGDYELRLERAERTRNPNLHGYQALPIRF